MFGSDAYAGPQRSSATEIGVLAEVAYHELRPRETHVPVVAATRLYAILKPLPELSLGYQASISGMLSHTSPARWLCPD